MDFVMIPNSYLRGRLGFYVVDLFVDNLKSITSILSIYSKYVGLFLLLLLLFDNQGRSGLKYPL